MIITKDTAAIVTGGASGLGNATARALVNAGAKVAIFDINAACLPTMVRAAITSLARCTNDKATQSTPFSNA